MFLQGIFHNWSSYRIRIRIKSFRIPFSFNSVTRWSLLDFFFGGGVFFLLFDAWIEFPRWLSYCQYWRVDLSRVRIDRNVHNQLCKVDESCVNNEKTYQMKFFFFFLNLLWVLKSSKSCNLYDMQLVDLYTNSNRINEIGEDDHKMTGSARLKVCLTFLFFMVKKW